MEHHHVKTEDQIVKNGEDWNNLGRQLRKTEKIVPSKPKRPNVRAYCWRCSYFMRQRLEASHYSVYQCILIVHPKQNGKVKTHIRKNAKHSGWHFLRNIFGWFVVLQICFFFILGHRTRLFYFWAKAHSTRELFTFFWAVGIHFFFLLRGSSYSLICFTGITVGW